MNSTGDDGEGGADRGDSAKSATEDGRTVRGDANEEEDVVVDVEALCMSVSLGLVPMLVWFGGVQARERILLSAYSREIATVTGMELASCSHHLKHISSLGLDPVTLLVP